MSSGKKDSVRGSCYKLQMSLFSGVLVRKQFSVNFILVNHFYLEMFGIMVDIFSLASFAIFVFQPWYILLSVQLAVFKLAFSNQMVILNLYRNFLINVNVF